MRTKAVIIGDSFGVRQIARYLPRERLAAIVAASIRPQYFDDLRKASEAWGVPLIVQPRYRSKEYPAFVKRLSDVGGNFLISNSYSMIIRADVLRSFDDGAINIHWALLPKNRGPNPIQWTIIRGEQTTGVTIHLLDEEVDCGDIVAQRKVDIDPRDTWVTLRSTLERASNELLTTEMARILRGKERAVRQDPSLATVNRRLTPEYPRIDFRAMNDTTIYNLIRAQVEPLQGAYLLQGERKIFFNRFVELEEVQRMRRQYGG